MKNERGFSPALSVQVRPKREKIHAHECDKGTVPLSHPGLALDRLDLQLYPLGTGVAQNIRKGPGRI